MALMIITIDGPAGGGKGTLAYHLAHIYNLSHLDTGLLYRAVALKTGEELNKEKAVKVASMLKIQDLTNPALRGENIGILASHIAAIFEVRDAILAFQRDFAHNPPAEKQGVVLDGRDIGSVVLPHAPCKIFITASPEVRAERRLKELHQKGINAIYKNILEDIKERDARDSKREISPLRPAEDAFILDTSNLVIDEVVEEACHFVSSKYPRMQRKQYKHG